MAIRRIDHVGLVVEDLATVRDFFVHFGMEVAADAVVEGEWVDRIIGLKDAKCAMVMMTTPDGEATLEIIQFERPVSEDGIRQTQLNAPGLRHVAFVVDDVEAIAARLQQKGAALLGEIVNYKDVYKLCCLRGPEGILLELAEELN
ncbi:MAG: glyoxalase [Verrucomicrobia bacterium 61-8]|nr:VOC family protein [Verrucomicrobiota bacterium]OJU99535.1 MAG: glyoxalase [Verrucomicrobia bacterium 61-8]